MFGGASAWYYHTVVGIRRAPGSRSWRVLNFCPPRGGILELLSWANASIDTPMGIVAASWSFHGDTYTAVAQLPPNAAGTISVPRLGSLISEGATPVWTPTHGFIPGVDGVAAAVATDEAVTFSIRSGRFQFTSHRMLEGTSEEGA